MWRPLPPQTEDLVTETSRLDVVATPRHFTVWDESTGDVIFNSVDAPQKFISSNPRVATADLMPGQIFNGLGNGDRPVQISGHSPGSALITPVNSKGQPLFNLVLEVDVLRRQEFRINFHLVTDWLGGTTARSASSAVQTDMSVVNDVFAPANISFLLHNTRSVNLSTRFDTRATDLQDFNRRMNEVIQNGRQFDGSPTNIQVFCVGMLNWLDGIEQGNDVQGRTIVIEDEAGPPVLSHEIGHVFGLSHNQRSGTLMNRFPSGTFPTRDDIRKIGMRR